jgi:hypothetical protein
LSTTDVPPPRGTGKTGVSATEVTGERVGSTTALEEEFDSGDEASSPSARLRAREACRVEVGFLSFDDIDQNEKNKN